MDGEGQRDEPGDAPHPRATGPARAHQRAQGDRVVSGDDPEIREAGVVQLADLPGRPLCEPATLEPRRDADLADVGDPCLCPGDPDAPFGPHGHGGQGAVGQVAGDQDVAGVALDGGAQEVVGLPLEAHADGARHRHRPDECPDLRLVLAGRQPEPELVAAAHRRPSSSPWRLSDSRRKSGL